MIKSFRDTRTQELLTDGWARGVPPDVARRALEKLNAINRVNRVEELRYPGGNRLHVLAGDRAGQYSIAVNRQWRICFSFVQGHAYDVEFCDYH
jgi:toxin HigB-1